MRHRLDHPEDVEGCFGCKVIGLQMSPGDASSQKMVSNKKWDGELEAYRAARADGIQPAGTSMKKIQEARRASDVMGKAFDAVRRQPRRLLRSLQSVDCLVDDNG
jgi:hypothetical protein